MAILLNILYYCSFFFDEQKKMNIFHLLPKSTAVTCPNITLFSGIVSFTDFPNGVCLTDLKSIVFNKLNPIVREEYSITLEWTNHILLEVTDIKVNCQKPKAKNAKMEFKAKQILPDALFQSPNVLSVVIFPV